ncbi:hypothetical protein Thermus77359_22670 [Thermus oshimai]
MQAQQGKGEKDPKELHKKRGSPENLDVDNGQYPHSPLLRQPGNPKNEGQQASEHARGRREFGGDPSSLEKRWDEVQNRHVHPL